MLDSFNADYVYGYATIYFMCAVIGIFTIKHLGTKMLKNSGTGKPSSEKKSWQRFKATA